MAYTPNPDDATQPTDAVGAETAQAEFRALKGKVNGVATAAGVKVPKRQAILSALMNGNNAAFLAAGTGLALNLLASTSPFVLTWAQGFNNAGEVDYATVIGTDQNDYWANLPANNLSYLSIDNSGNTINTTGTFVSGQATITAIPSTAGMTVGMSLSSAGNIQNNTVIKSVDSATQVTMSTNAIGSVVAGAFSAAGALTPTQTLAPPQYEVAYDQTRQSVLQFGGAAGSTTFLDDYGNTWTAGGAAKVQTNSFKFGTGGLGGQGVNNALDGAHDYIKSTNFTSLGNGGWSLRCWCNPSGLPVASAINNILNAGLSASSYGIYLAIYNNAGVIKFSIYLSSTGSSWDIANAVQGITTPVVGTWYFVELTFDAIAGVYRLYVNGTQEASVNSIVKICRLEAVSVGATIAGSNFFNGYIDKFEFLPYCDHPNGTAYAVPTAAPNVTTQGYSSDWFDIIGYKMWQVSAASTVAGSNPTFTNVQRLYVGEVTTGAAAPSSEVAYQPLGKYIGSWTTPFPAASTGFSTTDNIGQLEKKCLLEVKNLTAEIGCTPGQVVRNPMTGPTGFNTPMPPLLTKNTIQYATDNNALVIINPTNGVQSLATPANWAYRVSAERTW